MPGYTNPWDPIPPHDCYVIAGPNAKKPAFWAGLKRLIFQRKNGAAEWNRTIDLTLTKGRLEPRGDAQPCRGVRYNIGNAL